MPLGILVENPNKALLENGRRKRVGQDNHTIGHIGQQLHLEQPDLIQTPSKQIDRVSILGSAFRQAFVKLDLRKSDGTPCVVNE